MSAKPSRLYQFRLTHEEWTNRNWYPLCLARGRPTNPTRNINGSCRRKSQRQEPLVLLVAIALTVLLTACSGGLAPGPAIVHSVPPTETGPYRLGSGDKLHINVFAEAALSGDYTVDPNGYVAMPLAGHVKAAGETLDGLTNGVAKALRGDYLRDPKVTIQIAEIRPYYITGAVQKPGEYSYRPGLSVSAAVAVAGGYTFRASPRRFFVTRPVPLQRFEVDAEIPYLIVPGDIVEVPERYF